MTSDWAVFYCLVVDRIARFVKPLTSFQLSKCLRRVFTIYKCYMVKEGNHSSDCSSVFRAIGKDTFHGHFWFVLKQGGVCLWRVAWLLLQYVMQTFHVCTHFHTLLCRATWRLWKKTVFPTTWREKTRSCSATSIRFTTGTESTSDTLMHDAVSGLGRARGNV